MKIILRLLKLFLDNQFSLKDFISNFRSSGKEAAKNIAYVFLFFYMIIFFGGMLFFYVTSLYATFKEVGLQGFVVLLLSISVTFITFMFGFINTLSMYVTNATEENLLALPLSPTSLFTAKFLQIYVLELTLGATIIIFGTGVYGYLEGLLNSPVFYISVLIGSFTLPLIPVTLIFIVLVAIFSFGKNTLNKKILSFISTVILIACILGFNLVYQRALHNLNEPSFIMEFYERGGFDLIEHLAAFYPPAQWYVSAITGNGTSSIISLLLLSIIPCAFAAISIKVLAPFYVKSIIGFNEESSHKMNTEEARKFLSTDITSTPLFFTVLKRDILTVFKEPSFFFNGPFAIILIPIIISISLLGTLPNTGLDGLRSALAKLDIAQYTESQFNNMLFIIAGILSILVVFMGTSTCISATAFSREGKALAVLKALPIPTKTLLGAKIAHAMIYAFFSLVLIGIPGTIVLSFEEFHLSNKNIFLILCCTVFLSMSLSFLTLLFDLWIDTSHPKLNWETPTVALKQNLNSIFSILLNIGIIIILMVFSFLVLKKTLTSLFFLSCAIFLVDVLLWRIFVRRAEKKLALLEI